MQLISVHAIDTEEYKVKNKLISKLISPHNIIDKSILIQLLTIND